MQEGERLNKGAWKWNVRQAEQAALDSALHENVELM
jgi:hypothetical protein